MYRKLFAFILVTAFTATVAIAQDAPEIKPEKDMERARGLYRIALAGSGGYLGVRLKEVSNSNYAELGLSEVRGVAVERVLKDSAAEKAGLREGDVIVAFNGELVTSARKFSRLVSEVAPDHRVNLTVVRNGGEIEIPVTMGARRAAPFFTGDFDFPAPPAGVMAPNVPFPPTAPDSPAAIAPDIPTIIGPDGTGVFSFSSGRAIGVGVVSLTKQLGDYFGAADGKGLLINDVRKDSPAERAGLLAGDVIVEVDGKEVNRSFDLIREIGNKEGDVQLTIIRDRARQTISVTPEKREGPLRLRGYKYRTN